MTKEQKDLIDAMRREGSGYRAIAAKIGLPTDSIKSWCRRHPLEQKAKDVCLQCSASLTQTPHKRSRRFCSDECRFKWWSAHPEKRTHGKYEHKCKNCGKLFYNSRVSASYCGRACYALARRRKNGHD